MVGRRAAALTASTALAVLVAGALMGCARSVDGSGRPAADVAPRGAMAAAGSSTGPSAQATEEPTAEPTGEPTPEPTGTTPDPTADSAEDVEPADVAKGQTWLYTDGLEIGIVGVVPYGGAHASVLPGEYALKFLFEVTNAGPASVDLTKWGFAGECDGGAQLADALDHSLPEPTGPVEPGATAAYELGVAIEDSGSGRRCLVEVTPNPSYEPAWFTFTAPGT